jgi:hypothetical protein
MSTLEIVQILGALGEFVGAITVVITLIYLSRQVRESARQAQAAAVEAGRTRRITSFEAIRDSPYLPVIQAKLANGEPLDEEEQTRLTNHYAALWGLLYAEWIQRDIGTIGEYAPRPEIALGQVMGSPTAMTWWDQAGRNLYPERFIEFIDQKFAEIDLKAQSDLIGAAGFARERPTDAP